MRRCSRESIRITTSQLEHMLCLDGPITSVMFDPNTNHVVVYFTAGKGDRVNEGQECPLRSFESWAKYIEEK